MSTLNTKQIYVTPPQQPPQPTIPVQFVKPLSYEFRVAEIVDADGKIESVKLQTQIWEHDEYGSGTIRMTWCDVPRFKFDKNGIIRE